jgi:hypothetical protein
MRLFARPVHTADARTALEMRPRHLGPASFVSPQAPKRERRDVDPISDVVELLAAWRDHGDKLIEDLVFAGAGNDGFISSTVVLRRHPLPSDECGRDSAHGADVGEADVS